MRNPTIQIMPRRIESLLRLLKLFRGSRARERLLARIRRPVRLRVSQEVAVDAALGGVGFALAGISLLFAWEMIRTPHEAYIQGMQYLAIFAQPNSSALNAAQRSPPPAYAQSKPATGVDYAPTASIPNKEQQHRGGEAAETMGYEILSATKDVAWVKRGSEIKEVRKGDSVPGLGKIVSIEQEAGRWRLLLENGAKDQRATPKRISTTKPFAKPLIFDGPSSHDR